MAILHNVRWEAFARAVARRVTPLDALVGAGFKRWSRTSIRLMATEAVVARIEELEHRAIWGDSRELAPVIDALATLAKAAEKLESAAALVAARGLLAEAGRLKLLLPTPRTTAQIDAELSHEEWINKYGGKT